MYEKEQVSLTLSAPSYGSQEIDSRDQSMAVHVSNETSEIDRNSWQPIGEPTGKRAVITGQIKKPFSGFNRIWKNEQLNYYSGQSKDFCEEMWNNENTWVVVEIILYLMLGIYVLFASVLNFEDAKPLLAIYTAAILFYIHRTLDPLYSKLANAACTQNYRSFSRGSKVFNRMKLWLSVAFYTFSCIAAIAVTIYWNIEQPTRLKSAGGLAFLYLFSILISKHRSKINWRTAFWGLTLQFGFAIFVLRTEVGFQTFADLGDAAQDFLDFGRVGIDFVFKPRDLNELPSILGITTLMIVPFFSAFISALYHIGLMQFLIGKIAWVMQRTMGTSASESMSAAGNIFVGQTEAPLLVKPYLETMTLSELHAIMTGGFATIAGGVFAAYISMGVSASHLISASVMSAPAALTFSKIVYPETEEPIETSENDEDKSGQESPYENLIHAISSGATDGMTMVLNIIANLIAFLSLLAALNYIIGYLGALINISDLSLYKIFQFIFYPLAFILGADGEDCLKVGELLGLKTIANEFVAYQKMGHLMSRNQLTLRSQVIATYALCGFSNLGSIGIQIGGMGAIAPNRKGDLARIGFSAFITGNIACFSTACIAGLLYNQ